MHEFLINPVVARILVLYCLNARMIKAENPGVRKRKQYGRVSGDDELRISVACKFTQQLEQLDLPRRRQGVFRLVEEIQPGDSEPAFEK